MSDLGGQAPTPTGQAPSGTEQQGAPTGADAQDVSSLPEWAQRTIREIRDDAAKHRTSAKDRDAIAARLKTFEDSQLSEQQKLEARAKEFEQKAAATEGELRQERAHREVERAARKLNLVDEETALALVAGRIEYDDAGRPTNVAALLEGLVKDKPFLVGQPAAATPAGQQRPSASAANPNRGTSAAGTFTTSQIANRPFYEANREAIMLAYKEGRIVDD